MEVSVSPSGNGKSAIKPMSHSERRALFLRKLFKASLKSWARRLPGSRLAARLLSAA